MKTRLLLLLLLSLVISLTAVDLGITGINELEYVYRAVDDSLNHFLKDKFGFNLHYGNFNLGMKFIAELPRYDTFRKIEFLDNQDLAYEWKERYISYGSNGLFVLGGMFAETFGRGIVLSSFEDEDFDIDTRLEGVQLNFTKSHYIFKGVYGGFKSDIVGKEDKTNLAYGLDIDLHPARIITLGASVLGIRYIHSSNNAYSLYNVYGGRLNLITDFLELYGEAAHLYENSDYKEFASLDTKQGEAYYGNIISYLGKFTASLSYKNYDDFDHRLNDLPTVNYSGEPLSDNPNNPIGADEEGVMGELRFVPNFENEFIVNYAESWDSNKELRQADFYCEARHDFNDFSLSAEYSHLETVDDIQEKWEKKIKPALAVDFMMASYAVYTRAECEIINQEHTGEEVTYYEPLFQTDIDLDLLSLSFITEARYASDAGIAKARVYPGVEILADIYSSTQLKLFAGKEKGGKVCRNGTCRYQSSFEGIRLELITMF